MVLTVWHMLIKNLSTIVIVTKGIVVWENFNDVKIANVLSSMHSITV